MFSQTIYHQYHKRCNNFGKITALSLLLVSMVSNLPNCSAFPSSTLKAHFSDNDINRQSILFPDKQPSMTSNNGEQLGQSSRGCRSGELFSRDKEKCYKEGSQGPCGENMIFLKTLEDPLTGKCGCRPSLERALIYHPKFQQCYQIFTQGPCESGMLLMMDNGVPACKQDPCLFYRYFIKYKGREFIPYEDDCVQLNEPSSKCSRKNEIISLIDKGKTPACVKNPSSFTPLSISWPSSLLPCEEGSVLSYDNECHPILEFDLEDY